MSAVALAVVGVGKIARDQHLPAIAASDRFRLAAAVSPHPVDAGAPVFPTLAAMKAAVPEVAAVAICTPPVGRLALVREALALGLHVMIEKPPAATISEAERMATLAHEAGRSLFTAWHSREAAGVEPARAWLAERRLRAARVRWLEDVRVWHPGQEWIWEPGIGVFDPGINALSILTRVIDGPLGVTRAELRFPSNRPAPIAAAVSLTDEAGAPIDVALSFDQHGPQCWSIAFETDDGVLELADGGASLAVDGVAQRLADTREYPRLYHSFAELIAAGRSAVDLAPFRLVADCFLRADRREVGAFAW